MNQQKKQKKSNIYEFIENWNIDYPFDRWWRKKYNIPFGSKMHREASHIDMAIEYKEDLYFKHLNDQKSVKDFEMKEGTLISEIVALKLGKASNQQSKAEIDKDFNDLDLSQFNEKD